MDPLAPFLPALFLAALAYILRGRLPWWSAPLLAVLLVFSAQLAVLLSLQTVLESRVLVVEVRPDLVSYLFPILLSSLYAGLLTLLFTLLALGIERMLRPHIGQPFLRYAVAIYISLLLFQLWAEVFPWTFALFSRFYS